MSKNISRAIACLRIIEGFYIFIALGFFSMILFLVTEDSPQKIGLVFFIISFLIMMGLVIFLGYIVKDLRRKKFWAWVAGVCIFGLCLPTIFLPIGILGLFWLLKPEVRHECHVH